MARILRAGPFLYLDTSYNNAVAKNEPFFSPRNKTTLNSNFVITFRTDIPSSYIVIDCLLHKKHHRQAITLLASSSIMLSPMTAVIDWRFLRVNTLEGDTRRTL